MMGSTSTWASEAGFAYPVFGFMADQDMYGFSCADELLTNSGFHLKRGYALGMELVDAEGRSWRVQSVVRIGRKWPLLKHVLSRLITHPPYRIDYVLETLPNVSFVALKGRCYADLEKHVADIADFPEDGPAEVARLKALVEKATTAQQIYDIIRPDWF